MNGMRQLIVPVMEYPEAAEALLSGALVVRVPASGISDLAAQAMDLMQEMVPYFLALPESEQKRYMILRPPYQEEKDCDDGIIYRKGKGDPNTVLEDLKVFFHYRSRFRKWCRERGLDMTWFEPLLRSVSLIHAETWKHVLALGRELGRVSGADGLLDLLERQRQEYVLRVLQYQGLGDHGLLGNWHFDKSFLTAHIANSISGYVVRDPNNGEIRLVEPEPGTLLFFFGKQAEIVFAGDTRIRAIKHCATDLRQPGDARLRNSIVGFAHMVSPETIRGLSGKVVD